MRHSEEFHRAEVSIDYFIYGQALSSAFIRRSRELGFSLDEIRMLLQLADQGAVMCSASVKEVTVQHLANVRAKIASLKKLERALNRMTGTCTPGEPLPCPILEALSAPA